MLLSRFTAPDYLLRAEKDKLVRVHRLNAMRKRPLDLGKRLRELGQKTVHNAFHYEAIGYARELKVKTLIGFLTGRLAEIDELMNADRIGP
jgi:hypothetical protein